MTFIRQRPGNFLPTVLQIHRERRISPMLKYYVKTTEALKRLRTDQDGVVSFEYIIVAVCIIGAVSAVFGVGAGGAIGQSLTAGITAITNAFTAAV
ncbi:Flp family type IVb pilin [Bradyrhizobium paxllaeri]|uniref:Flp family type IVb pilin n=1 Tax=Bradyrhizobium paxllaeri TaxID=190148 RepID=UPI003221B2C2